MAKRATLTTPGARALYSKTVLDNNFSAINENFDNFLHRSGTGESGNSTLGTWDMGGYEIINGLTPTVSSSLATKGYVDQTLTIASTTGTIGSLIVDADGDTYIKTEASADNDTINIAAAVSGGSADAFTVVGNPAASASVSNPATTVQRNLIMASGVKLGDAAVPNTYVELTRSGSADNIFAVAGGNAVLSLSSDTILASQHITMATGKVVGDLDGDTYITFNEGSDDDTVRIYAGGVEQLTITATTVSLAINTVPGSFGVGGADPTIAGATNFISITEGTPSNLASDMADNEILIYASNVTGIETQLNLDFKTAVNTKATVVLGEDCAFPNDLNIGGNGTITGTLGVTDAVTLSSTLSAGATSLTTTAITGTLDVSGATVLASTLGVTGATTLSTLNASTLTVAGAANLNAGGALVGTFTGAKTFSGTTALTGGGELTGTFSGTKTFSGVSNINSGGALAGTFSGTKTFSGATTQTGALTLSGTIWPSFKVHLTSTQTAITGIEKLLFDSEEFDSGSYFSGYKFTPPVGTYLLSASSAWGGITAGDLLKIFIYKNGSEYASSATDAGGAKRNAVTVITQANGTDYFEVFVENVNRDTSFAVATTDDTYFIGSRIA